MYIKISNTEVYKYLRSFMIQNEWDNIHEQARCIFTTLCLMEQINSRTSLCDKLLATLYSDAAMEYIMTYNSFENFMTTYI